MKAGPTWGIFVKNSSGRSLNNTKKSSVKRNKRKSGQKTDKKLSACIKVCIRFLPYSKSIDCKKTSILSTFEKVPKNIVTIILMQIAIYL